MNQRFSIRRADEISNCVEGGVYRRKYVKVHDKSNYLIREEIGLFYCRTLKTERKISKYKQGKILFIETGANISSFVHD